jgi:hypothetical protein
VDMVDTTPFKEWRTCLPAWPVCVDPAILHAADWGDSQLSRWWDALLLRSLPPIGRASERAEPGRMGSGQADTAEGELPAFAGPPTPAGEIHRSQATRQLL